MKKREWTAWLVIAPLSLVWLFCLTLPSGALVFAWRLFSEGELWAGAVAVLLAGPAAWPLLRCSRSIRGYYSGSETFRLSFSRKDIVGVLIFLAVLAFLVYNAVNYVDLARR
ncbi:MAG TPA: hypothetical protein DDW67_02880 [Elusimicrobia bacterium]|nr:hypothetical protein [Elusimicrobiota bacterium]